MIIRLAMSDFTFSDGTFIPKGSSLAVSGRAMNQDEVKFRTLLSYCSARTDRDLQLYHSVVTPTLWNSKGSVSLGKIL